MAEYDLNRDAKLLEPHFTKHMSAMTGEGLHSKSDIACELAHRDQEITRLREQLADAEKAIGCCYLVLDMNEDKDIVAMDELNKYRNKYGSTNDE